MNDKLKKGIKYLAKYNNINVNNLNISFNTFRALMNVTMPEDLNDEYYIIQDEIIKDEYNKRIIIEVNDLDEVKENIYLYLGDITNLKVDAIVNACNCKLLGCFQPLHRCIDNAIHSFARTSSKA